jgi:hypothetical protein
MLRRTLRGTAPHAEKNPTWDGDAVALTIPAKHRKFLRDLFEIARSGIREELAQYPKQLKEPRRLHREEAVYEKLLAALDTGSIVPNCDVRDVLRDLAEIYDRENEYDRVSPSTRPFTACSDDSAGEGRWSPINSARTSPIAAGGPSSPKKSWRYAPRCTAQRSASWSEANGSAASTR